MSDSIFFRGYLASTFTVTDCEGATVAVQSADGASDILLIGTVDFEGRFAIEVSPEQIGLFLDPSASHSGGPGPLIKVDVFKDGKRIGTSTANVGLEFLARCDAVAVPYDANDCPNIGAHKIVGCFDHLGYETGDPAVPTMPPTVEPDVQVVNPDGTRPRAIVLSRRVSILGNMGTYEIEYLPPSATSTGYAIPQHFHVEVTMSYLDDTGTPQQGPVSDLIRHPGALERVDFDSGTGVGGCCLQTTFEGLLAALAKVPHLGASADMFVDLAAADTKTLQSVACHAEIDEADVSLLAKLGPVGLALAQDVGTKESLPQVETDRLAGLYREWLFGLAKRNVDPNARALLSLGADSLESTLEAAAEACTIRLPADSDLTQFLGYFDSWAGLFVAGQPPFGQTTVTAQVWREIRLSQEFQVGPPTYPNQSPTAEPTIGMPVEQFVEQYRARTDSDAFWAGWSDALEGPRARFGFEFGLICGNHVGLVTELLTHYNLETYTQPGVATVMEDLARLSVADWLVHVQAAGGAISTYVGADQAERDQNFATALYRFFADFFPNTVLNGPLLTRLNTDDPSTWGDLFNVFTNAGAPYDFIGTTIDPSTGVLVDPKFWVDQNAPTATTEQKAAYTCQIAQLADLVGLADRDDKVELIAQLVAIGVTSAAHVLRMGKGTFLRKAATQPAPLGDVTVAKKVLRRAGARIAKLNQVLAPSILGGAEHGAIGLPTPTAEEKDRLGPFLRDKGVCVADHSESVLGPAAYMVEVADFIKNRETDTQADAWGELLDRGGVGRRPDLEKIRLVQANTVTPIPQIDLANELMEAFVLGVDGSGLLDEAATPDLWNSTVSAEDHRVAREHHPIDTAGQTALDLLENVDGLTPGEKMAWSLPYDHHHARQSAYLSALEQPRGKWLSSFIDLSDAAGQERYARAVLDVSSADYVAFDETTNVLPENLWTGAAGYETAFVDELLKASQLSLHDFLATLNLRAMGGGGQRAPITLSLGPDSCDVADATLGGGSTAEVKDALDRMYRFERLRMKTGWDRDELDAALGTALPEQLTVSMLHELLLVARVSALSERFPRVDKPVLAALLMGMYTGSDENPGLYGEVFQPPGADRSAFALNATRTDTAAPVDLQDPGNRAHVLGVLGLREEDLGALETALSLTGSLTLAQLSTLYRCVQLAKLAGLSIADLSTAIDLLGFDPAALDTTVAHSFALEQFLDQLELLDRMGVTIAELDYLATSRIAAGSSVGLSDEARTALTAVTGRPAIVLPMEPPTIGVDLANHLTELYGSAMSGRLMAVVNDPGGATHQESDVEIDRLFAPLGLEDASNVLGTDGELVVANREKYVLGADGGYAIVSSVYAGALQEVIRLRVTDYAAADLSDAAAAGVGEAAVNISLSEEETNELLLPIGLQYAAPGSPAPATPGVRANAIGARVRENALRTELEALLPTHVGVPQEFAYELGEKAANATGLHALFDGSPDAAGIADWAALAHKGAYLLSAFAELPAEYSEALRLFADFTQLVEFPMLAQSNAVEFTQRYELPGDVPAAVDPQVVTGLLRTLALVDVRQRYGGSDADVAQVLGVLESAATANDVASALPSALDMETFDASLAADLALTNISQLTVAELQAFDGIATLLKRVDAARAFDATAAEMDVHAGDATQAAGDTAEDALARGVGSGFLKKGEDVQDELRVALRDALVGYLRMRTPQGTEPGFSKESDFFDFFLIDPFVTPCFYTSRIKQAISSMQTYVQRAMLGLEPNFKLHADEEEQWAWMKRYRVWEANRKVFLYPENFLEPELRDDKTPLFEELEVGLRRGELTSDRADELVIDYLRGLSEVANMTIRGVFAEAGDEHIHVFGSPRGSTQLYHRERIRHVWTPWREMGVEVDGEHLLPTMLNGRLHVFWALITPNGSSVPSSNDPERYAAYRVQLRWTSLDKDVWASTLMSEGFLETNSVFAPGRIVPARVVPSDFLLEAHPGRSGVKGSVEILVSMQYRGLFSMAGELDAYLPVGTFTVAPSGDVTIIQEGEVDSSRVRSILGQEGVDQEDPSSLLPVPAGHRLNGQVLVADDGNTLRLPLLDFEGTLMLSPRVMSTPRAYRIATSWNYTETSLPLFTEPFVFEDARGSFLVTSKDASEVTVPNSDPLQASVTIWADGGGLQGAAPGRFYFTPSLRAPNDQGVGQPGQTWRDVAPLQPGGGEIERRKFRFEINYHPFAAELLTTAITSGVEAVYVPPVDAEPGLERQGRTEVIMTRGPSVPNPSGINDAHAASDLMVVDDIDAAAFDFSASGAYSAYNWELFFHVPMLISQQLAAAGQFEAALEWFKRVFDPTAEGAGANSVWNFRPFYEAGSAPAMLDYLQKVQGATPDPAIADQVEASVDDPFSPHLIARLRPAAYQRWTLMRYAEFLVKWGDDLFRQDSIESINEALQLYLLALSAVGAPAEVIRRAAIGTSEAKTLAQVGPDDEGCLARVAIWGADQSRNEDFNEPFRADGTIWEDRFPGPGLGLGASFFAPGGKFYFALTVNPKLERLWNTVRDRLFKVRNCLNIDGIERSLALFEPPIDPAALIRAFAAGTFTAGAKRKLLPYRFTRLLGVAKEYSATARGLGDAMAQAIERGDAAELERLRSEHEEADTSALLRVRREQIRVAKEQRAALDGSLANARTRVDSYQQRLAESQTPDSDQSEASDSSANGAVVMEAEADRLAAKAGQLTGSTVVLHSLSAGLAVVPTSHWGTAGANWSFGTSNVTSFVSGMTGAIAAKAGKTQTLAGRKSTEASFARRKEDWQLQLDLAKHDIDQIKKQMDAADVQIAIAQKELENSELRLAEVREVGQFLKDRFSSQELFNWQARELEGIYSESYDLALDMARAAEDAYAYELGIDAPKFVGVSHWEGRYKGLLAGQRLGNDLSRMETAYLENHKREYELTKRVSLAQLDPHALVELRQSGQCVFAIPEEAFDLDHPGHYFRRIKSVGVTLSGVVGPYTNAGLRLALTKSEIRRAPTLAVGQPPVADLFGVESIATSGELDDSGLFQLNFNDERRLPFEGKGVISNWSIKLPNAVRQFDYSTIADVVLTIRYTAREGGDALRTEVESHLASDEAWKQIGPSGGVIEVDPPPDGVALLLSAKGHFPAEYATAVDGGVAFAGATLTSEMIPHAIREAGAPAGLNVTHVVYRLENEEEADAKTVTVTPQQAVDATSTHVLPADDAGHLIAPGEDLYIIVVIKP